MGIENHRIIRENAFMGGMNRQPDLIEAVNQTAKRMDEILNPIDDPAKRKAVGDSIRVIRGLGIQVDSVTTLNETLVDKNKTEAQQENAEVVLEVLAKGVYVAMRYGKNDELRDVLGRGSAAEINNLLPEPLKGLGERVRANIIDEPQILEVLDGLDKIRIRAEKAGGRAGGRLLAAAIDRSLNTLVNLEVDSKEGENQVQIVMAYLVAEMEMIGGGEKEEVGQTVIEPLGEGGENRTVESLTLQELVAEVTRLRRRVNMSGVGANAGKDGGMGLGAAESYEALEDVTTLKDFTDEAVFDWAAKTVDWIAREQLFFAGAGWQQFGPYMEREVRKLYKKNGKKEVEINKAIEIVRAVLAPRLYEEAMMHSDGAIAIFVKTLPQAGVFDKNEWSKERRSFLLTNPLVGYFHEEIYNLIQIDPKRALEMMADSEKANIMAEYLKDRLLEDADKIEGLNQEHIDSDPGRVQSLARVAVSVFLVDDLPDIIMWANSSKSSVEIRSLIDQIKPKRKLNSERMAGDVVAYDTMFNRTLNFSHPLVGLRRPVDIYRANNVWNEVILGEVEQALWGLADEVFIVRGKKKNSKGVEIETRRFKRCSEMGLKNMDRWDAMVTALIGGTQAEALDNFQDLDKGLEKMQKLIQNDPDMADIGGAIAAKLIKAKVMALLSENRRGFGSNIMRALAIERSSVPKEMSDALGRMAGSGMDTSFGSIKEAVARLGFNFLGCKDLVQAIAMLVTETNDPNDAEANLRKKKVAMILKAIVDLSQETSGGGGKRK